jgi:hypothetical protein
MGHAAAQEQAPDASYRRMKVTDGGVMLLVRLYADLQTESPAVLKTLAEFDRIPSFKGVSRISNLPVNSRLHKTFEWLERQFGSATAAKAVAETAQELLAP